LAQGACVLARFKDYWIDLSTTPLRQ